MELGGDPGVKGVSREKKGRESKFTRWREPEEG